MLITEFKAIPLSGRIPTAGALSSCGGALAYPNGEVTAWLGAEPRQRMRFDFAAQSLCSSADGTLVGAVAAGGTRFVLVETSSGAVRLAAEAPDPRRQPLVATIAHGGTGPIALYSRRPGELEGFDPQTGVAFARRIAAFRVTALQPLGSGSHLGLLGHFAGETKDSLAVISVDRVLMSATELDDQLQRKAGMADYAYRLGLGPYDQRSFVGSRDPEDDEDEPDPEGPLTGLRGFYLRSLDGTVSGSLSWNGEIPAGSAICGAQGIVAWAERDNIMIADIRSARETTSVAAKWLACAGDGSAVLLAKPNGEIGMLRWQRGST